MTDQVSPEGGALPSDANASQAKPTTDVVTSKPGSEAGSSPAAPDSGDVSKPKQSGEDRRIAELTRRWREEQRRSDRLMAMIEDNNRKASQPAQVAIPGQPQQPKPVDTAEAIREAAEKLLKQQEAASRRATFDKRAGEFAKNVEDYDDVVAAGVWACSEAMAEVIEDSDEGPAIAYYLAQNPSVAEQIYRHSPAKAGRELALIESRLVAERKKAAEATVTKAPPPPPKIEANDPGNVDQDPSKMTDLQFAKWRKKQISQRGR